MGRISKLLQQYEYRIAVPWQKDLPGAQRIFFVVYEKEDERELRLQQEAFKIVTGAAGHGWEEYDLSPDFAQWMKKGMEKSYRESYFASPQDLAFRLEEDFLGYVAGRLREKCQAAPDPEKAVVAVFGAASLFGLVRLSRVLKEVEQDIRGRLVVFFPGEYEKNDYHLLGSRDGWNYLAVPITLSDGN